MDAMGLGVGSSPCPRFREGLMGTGVLMVTVTVTGSSHHIRQHWGVGAMPTPPVSQLRGCSAPPPSLFTGGGGQRRRVPRATRVTRTPCPLSQPSAVSAALAWTYATI